MKKDTKNTLRALTTDIKKALPEAKRELGSTLDHLLTQAYEEDKREKSAIRAEVDKVRPVDEADIQAQVKARIDEELEKMQIAYNEEIQEGSKLLLEAVARKNNELDNKAQQMDAAQQRYEKEAEGLQNLLIDKLDGVAGITSWQIILVGDIDLHHSELIPLAFAALSLFSVNLTAPVVEIGKFLVSRITITEIDYFALVIIDDEQFKKCNHPSLYRTLESWQLHCNRLAKKHGFKEKDGQYIKKGA